MSSQPEPEWDDTERAWMLSLARWRTNEQCPRCGQPKYICQDPAAESTWVADLPIRCHITTAILRAQNDYLSGAAPASYPQALVWPVKRQDRANTRV